MGRSASDAVVITLRTERSSKREFPNLPRIACRFLPRKQHQLAVEVDIRIRRGREAFDQRLRIALMHQQQLRAAGKPLLAAQFRQRSRRPAPRSQ